MFILLPQANQDDSGGLVASLILSGKLVSLDNSGNPPPNWFLPLGTAGFSLSLVVNVLVTTTLVGRLLTFMRQTREVFPTTHHSYLNPILAVLIESGMLMLAAQMAYVIVFKLNTSPFWLLEGPIVMIYVCPFFFSYYAAIQYLIVLGTYTYTISRPHSAWQNI